MTDQPSTKFEPIAELNEMRQRLADLEARCQAAEEARRYGEEKLHTLINSASDGFLVLDSELKVTDVSKKAWFQRLGLDESNIMGKHILEILPYAKKTGDYDKLVEMLKMGEPAALDFSVSRPKLGDLRLDIEVFIRVVKAGDGLLIITSDVTERRRAQEQLQESERRYRLLAENVTDVIWTMDMNLVINYVSPSVSRLLGYAVEEVRGRVLDMGIGEVVTPSSLETVKAFWQEVTLESQGDEDTFRPGTLDLEMYRKDGSTVWTESTITFLHAPDGQPVGILGVTRDISERKQAEKALRDLSSRLVEMQETGRRHYARELHDQIGQTLTGLKLSLEMAARRQQRGAAWDFGYAQRLINEIMTQVSDLSLDLRPLMLDDLGLLPALRWHLDRYTAQTGVRVRFQHDGLDRRFPADVETAAFRIVQEALTNVARHSGVRKATLQVLANQDRLKMEIEDRGSGFDLQATLRRGISSGLTGMRERATFLGGKLTVDSVPGRGTRLVADLPLGARDKEVRR